MIGNDIVDLKTAEIQNNWQRKGWVQKIFTVSEQNQVMISENPHHLVWKFWSMKEATYKAHQRQFLLAPKFNPKDFVCTDSIITIGNYSYFSISKLMNDRCLYTIASSITLRNVLYTSRVFKNSFYYYKNELKKIIAEELKIHSSRITIEKNDNGIPMIMIDHKLTDIQFSLTSHGSFTAFVIVL
ncbi:4'-phosphopantetheinyl transferase superfamily protein [Aquimarina sp. RZ0]|uniref:4'-phosphopantetheinyl transferase superfamily protein n=1 Tax=Aquimarina sp. RZ0 TaxID=2607730 RepID=UPI0011F3131F|nr:4'-phosphopantetheinyl transferase superfamily protein [Aquimarina sp. RZ0]KAA1244675.1 4'-phosphopantetheinyl transferase superfamily protein [Aquimarina sp. RZ0]